MRESIAFAIGCFHFGLKKISSNGMNGIEYIRELRNSLESIPNINNIEIKADNAFDELRIEPNENLSTINDGQSFFPPSSYFLEIYFDIYIPNRLQSTLYTGMIDESYPEKFKVHIKDSYYLPVTFVEIISENNIFDPSKAVIMIREFLERQFEEKNFEFIQFECLGPSPFHADFFMYVGDEKSSTNFDMNGFSIEYIPQMGYATINIYYDKRRFSTLWEAKEALFFEFSSEVGMLYKIVQHNNIQMNEWGRLEVLLQNVIESARKKGFKNIWYRSFHFSRQIQDAIIALSEFESGRIWTSFFIRTGYRHLLKGREKPYFNDYLKEEINQFPEYPVKQAKEIIELLEGRRSKTIDNLILVIAAIFGGAIGALITLLVSPK